MSVNNVKCVLDVNGYALYFSRALIPHNKTARPGVPVSIGRLSFDQGIDPSCGRYLLQNSHSDSV
jgi:CMP-2-keto-3-deoxyoctulosonic acid synthetase